MAQDALRQQGAMAGDMAGWCCSCLDLSSAFNPTFDVSCTRQDFYPWGDVACCGFDCACCGLFEVRPLSTASGKTSEWTEGFCQPDQPDFYPTCVPRALCCPCCLIAETYTVMNGGEADGMCGETGAIMCTCLAAFYIICGLGPVSVPLCAVVERRYVMKRYNIEGQGNPCCWLLGVCWCCAHYQQRAFVLAYAANGPTNDPLMPVTKQPTTAV